MDYYDALREAARRAGLPLTQIGPKLGHGASYVNAAVSRGSLPKVDNAAAMLGACGWSLVAVPSDAVPDGALVVDGGAAAQPDKAAQADKLRRQADKLQVEAARLNAQADALQGD